MSDGITTTELEQRVGEKVPAKVVFYLHGTSVFFRIGNLWYSEQEPTHGATVAPDGREAQSEDQP